MACRCKFALFYQAERDSKTTKLASVQQSFWGWLPLNSYIWPAAIFDNQCGLVWLFATFEDNTGIYPSLSDANWKQAETKLRGFFFFSKNCVFLHHWFKKTRKSTAFSLSKICRISQNKITFRLSLHVPMFLFLRVFLGARASQFWLTVFFIFHSIWFLVLYATAKVFEQYPMKDFFFAFILRL